MKPRNNKPRPPRDEQFKKLYRGKHAGRTKGAFGKGPGK